VHQRAGLSANRLHDPCHRSFMLGVDQRLAALRRPNDVIEEPTIARLRPPLASCGSHKPSRPFAHAGFQPGAQATKLLRDSLRLNLRYAVQRRYTVSTPVPRNPPHHHTVNPEEVASSEPQVSTLGLGPGPNKLCPYCPA
jgi:hypothetical protein